MNAMVAVCVVCVVLAFALGAFAPWPFVQTVVATLIGSVLAGLVIFYLANIAFGFTERRESARLALRTAYEIVLPELLENEAELRRIAQAVREGSFTLKDPVFAVGERVREDYWQLLVQSPLGARLPHTVFLTAHISYYVSRIAVKQLRETNSGMVTRTPEEWKELWDKHLPHIEFAATSVNTAVTFLTDEYKLMRMF